MFLTTTGNKSVVLHRDTEKGRMGKSAFTVILPGGVIGAQAVLRGADR